MALNKDEIIKSLDSMTIVELNDLVKSIESHFGVTAAIAAAPSEGNGSKAEPTEANIILTGLGAAPKVKIIKLVSKLLGKGLMDSKKIVEKLPATIKEHVKMDEAEEIKSQFIDAGAIAELK